MTVKEAESILSAIFNVVDRIGTLHLTGGGEPFLHPKLAELIEASMVHSDRFDKLMLFTNSTVLVSDKLIEILKRYKDKIIIQTSRYGINPAREAEIHDRLNESGAKLKVEKYYGEDQSFGGWVDFGKWESYGRTPEELSCLFNECSVTRVLHGNWRTRDGKVHWCTRSQRGMELGLIPNNPSDYIDLFDTNTSCEEKRAKFQLIAEKNYISACDYCSGDAGTTDKSKRYPAAEQI